MLIVSFCLCNNKKAFDVRLQCIFLVALCTYQTLENYLMILKELPNVISYTLYKDIRKKMRKVQRIFFFIGVRGVLVRILIDCIYKIIGIQFHPAITDFKGPTNLIGYWQYRN